MALNAIIFDVDGTIAETDEIHRAAFNLSFRDKEIRWHWSHSVYARLSDAQTPQEKLHKFITEFRSDDLDDMIASGMFDAVVARANRHFNHLIESGSVSLRPGVARVIKEARNARVKLALCTVSPVQSFEVLLQNHFGLSALDIFDTVTTRETLSPGADTLTAYQTTIQRLGCAASDCVAIDDSELGVNAARAAGMFVLATPGIYTCSGDFSQADLVISDLGHPAAPFQLIRGDTAMHNFVSIDAMETWSDNLDRSQRDSDLRVRRVEPLGNVGSWRVAQNASDLAGNARLDLSR